MSYCLVSEHPIMVLIAVIILMLWLRTPTPDMLRDLYKVTHIVEIKQKYFFVYLQKVPRSWPLNNFYIFIFYQSFWISSMFELLYRVTNDLAQWISNKPPSAWTGVTSPCHALSPVRPPPTTHHCLLPHGCALPGVLPCLTLFLLTPLLSCFSLCSPYRSSCFVRFYSMMYPLMGPTSSAPFCEENIKLHNSKLNACSELRQTEMMVRLYLRIPYVVQTRKRA